MWGFAWFEHWRLALGASMPKMGQSKAMVLLQWVLGAGVSAWKLALLSAYWADIVNYCQCEQQIEGWLTRREFLLHNPWSGHGSVGLRKPWWNVWCGRECEACCWLQQFFLNDDVDQSWPNVIKRVIVIVTVNHSLHLASTGTSASSSSKSFEIRRINYSRTDFCGFVYFGTLQRVIIWYFRRSISFNGQFPIMWRHGFGSNFERDPQQSSLLASWLN